MTAETESCAGTTSIDPLEKGSVAVVIAGGSCPTPEQLDWVFTLSPQRLVVAADSGADHARMLELQVDVAVGDFDSASDQTQSWLQEIKADVAAHPAEKDASDLELALAVAVARDPMRIVVLGLGGGRADHALINLLVLADDRWASQDVMGISGDSLISVVRREFVATGLPGSLLSLVAVGGPARLQTESLLFPLDDEYLEPTSSRGLSNVIVGACATVNVSEGVVLAIQPHASDYLWAPAR